MSPGAPPPIRLYTLGRPDLRSSDRAPVLSVVQQPKRLALLVYLAVATPRGFHRRDTLLGMFWPELDEEHARNALNQAIFRLRRSLGERALVSRGNDELGVDRDHLGCDAVDFEESIAGGADQEALELYRGDFLEGLSVDGVAPELEHWIDGQRARLRDLAVRAAWRLARAEEEGGNGAGAVRWGWRAAELSPTDERGIGQFVDLLERQGDRAGALSAYEGFVRRLSAEYDLEPSEELCARVERIRCTPAAPARPPAAPRPAPEERRAAPVAGAGVERRTRLIVLPFRMLRPDPETEFLTFSLPDAITSSLAGLRSLVVRSNLAARPFSGDEVDLRVIASRTEVDVILTGTLLRAGEQLRVSCQLTDANDGTLLWSQTSQAPLRDLFEVQDQLARSIVDSLRLPLTAREEQALGQDVPTTARAYEFYLRANQLAYVVGRWSAARDLYLQALEEDPRYAPAWARLARCYRLIAKWSEDEGVVQDSYRRAEEAFERALRINPGLGLAHNLYAQLEVELGRTQEALVRLVTLARSEDGSAELFAGLVHVGRFCGLLEASLAAHTRARVLDPAATTSVAHTRFMMQDFHGVLENTFGDIGYIAPLALASLGRTAEAIDLLRQNERSTERTTARPYLASLRALLEGKREEALAAIDQSILTLRDPEALYYLVRQLARLGEHERAIVELQRVVSQGFFCSPAFARDPWLDPLRAHPGFERVLRDAETLHSRAVEDFLRAGGDDVLQLRAGILTFRGG